MNSRYQKLLDDLNKIGLRLLSKSKILIWWAARSERHLAMTESCDWGPALVLFNLEQKAWVASRYERYGLLAVMAVVPLLIWGTDLKMVGLW